MLTTSEVTLVVAGIALVGTAITVIQKRYTDRRDAWWNRTQWALECVVADQDEVKRTVGLAMLTALEQSRLAANGDRRMIEDAADSVLALVPVEERSNNEHDVASNGFEPRDGRILRSGLVGSALASYAEADGLDAVGLVGAESNDS